MALIIPLLFAAVVYFLLIRPQQRQARQHTQLVATLEVGDEVLTGSGIYGTITEIDGEDITVAIADGVEVRMAKRAVVEVAVDDDTDDDAQTDEGTDDESGSSPIVDGLPPADGGLGAPRGNGTGADSSASADDR